MRRYMVTVYVELDRNWLPEPCDWEWGKLLGLSVAAHVRTCPIVEEYTQDALDIAGA